MAEPIKKKEVALVMGYEHESSFAPPLKSPALERLLTCLKSPPTWPLLRAEQNGQTYVMRYAYVAGVLPVWEEDFLLCLSNQQLYLLLHTATAEQESAVLAWLKECLRSTGLATPEFQEL